MRLVVAAAAAIAMLVLPSVAGAANPWLARTALNIAHQGGEIEAPSDTMYAFRTALDKGADVLEMDVHLSKDGHVVVMHDETVNRTTNGAGSVESMTLPQIKSLDAAYWFVPDRGTTYTGQPGDYALRGIATGAVPPPPGYSAADFTIPTLEEVLRAFPETLINVELKPTIGQTGKIELAVRDLLRRFGRTDDVIVVSFLDHSITLFKALAPEITTAPATVQVGAFWAASQGALPGIPLPIHVALQVPEVFSGLPVMSKDFVDDAHRNALAVHVWTINDAAAMRRLLDWRVDGIMTDRPRLLEQILAERRAGPLRLRR
jgi:glycerophosphoryl diester phosphodiesterase